MKFALRIMLFIAAALWAAGSPAQEPTSDSPPWLAAEPYHLALKAGMLAVMAPQYDGDLSRALEAADSFLAEHPGHPLPLIMKARVLREKLLEQDWNTDVIKEESVPIHALLDQAVNICENETGRPSDIFYRGWARMFKSQLHAIAVSNYSAGRAAASGHGDLEKYLELEPYDPDARGFMGIYQYYASALPAMAKFFGKLLFIPGGNEAKGLANMRFACAKNGPMLTDHQVVRASTFVFFAGRLEEALPGFREVLQRHPGYLRLAEPLTISALLYPAELRSLRQMRDQTINRHVQLLEEKSDWETLRRISFFESMDALLYRSPTEALEGFARIADKGMVRPDWMDPFAHLNQACLLANSGHPEQARAIFEELTVETVPEKVRSAAKACLEDPASWNNQDLVADFRFVCAIHDGQTEVAVDGLKMYGLRHGDNLVHSFYSGELALVEGDAEKAAGFFQKALEVKAPVTQQVFRMFAAARLAEIKGVRGDFKGAANLLGQAIDMRLNEPTLKLVLKGRKRYYEKLEKDETAPTPGLVTATIRVR